MSQLRKPHDAGKEITPCRIGSLMEVAVVEGGRFLITPQVTLDRAIVAGPKKNRKQMLQALSAAVDGIRQESKKNGLAKLTMKQITAEVTASRRTQPQKKSKQPIK